MTNLARLERDGPIARLTVCRPERLNALNSALRAELLAGFRDFARDPDVRVVVLTGEGHKAFVAGADIEELVDLTTQRSEALSLEIMVLHETMRALPVPVVAAINGWCLGGGLELALACDLRIAAEGARFGFPEVKLGIIPGGGGTARLVRLVGPGVARMLCMTGEPIDADRALRLGLVNEVVEPADLKARVDGLAQRLAGYSPLALRQLKSVLDIAEHADLGTSQRAEAKACALCFGTEAQRSLMQAFLARRPR